MDTLLKFLQQFNSGAGIVTSLMTPTGAIGVLLNTIKAFRDRRAAGDIVTVEELDAAIKEFDKSVEALIAANAAYYNIPVKSDPDVS